MKIANLDHIENFIQESVKKHMADLGKLRLDRQDRIGLHQLIVKYLESPLLKDVYIKSAIFEYKEQIFVKTLRFLDVDNYAKADLEDIYQLNEAYIKESGEVKTYDDFKHVMDNACQWQKYRDDSFPIQIAQSLYPQLKVPRTALSLISMVNENEDNHFMSSKRELLETLVHDEDVQDLSAISRILKDDEYIPTKLVNAVAEDLKEDTYYRLFFDSSKYERDRNKLNLKVATIGKDFFNPFCHVKSYKKDPDPLSSNNQSFRNKAIANMDLLKDDYGLIYCGYESNEGCTAVYATNSFDELVGVLFIGKKLFGNKPETDEINQDAHYLKSVAVHKSFRGQGVSLKLFQKAIEVCKDKHWILVRTLASEDGANYIEDKFNRYLEKNRFPFVVSYKDKEKAMDTLSVLYDKDSSVPREQRWQAFQDKMETSKPQIKTATKTKSKKKLP